MFPRHESDLVALQKGHACVVGSMETELDVVSSPVPEEIYLMVSLRSGPRMR